jgi:ABC-type uncharacterized transport system auxiliary subunit
MLTPFYLEQFCNDLQIQIVKALKRADGSCIKRGKLTVTKKVEKYLLKQFLITKRFQQSNILDKLRMDQNIVKDKDVDLSEIKDFKIKFGNNSVIKYKTRQNLKNSNKTFNKTLIASRIFHWEFRRNIDMAEIHDKIALDAFDARFEARTLEWKNRTNKI